MADSTSNESGAINFQPYLQSICHHYQQWWTRYTLTDASEGREALKSQSTSWDDPLDFFSLMVQTVQQESGSEAEATGSDHSNTEGEVEGFPVVEEIRKYARDPVLLVGRPGSGKSTALIRLLLEEARTLSPASQTGHEKPEQIPVLVELRFWQTSILELIRDFFRRHGLNLDHSQIEHLLFHNRLLLLVDGLNELPSEAARQDVAKFRCDYPQSLAVFTTRDLNLGEIFGIAKKLRMLPLTAAQMQDFVRAHLAEQADAMLQGLGPRLREFGKTPLLLWMLCSLFKQTGQIPPNLGGVFRAFTQSYERNLKGDVVPEGNRRWWSELLQTLAFAMMHSRSRLTAAENPVSPVLDVEVRVAIPKAEVHKIFVECLKLKEAQPEGVARKCLDDLLRHHLVQANGDQLEFRHQLIQEYYAAEYLLMKVEQLPDLALQQQYLNYLKWTEPAALMMALIEDGLLAERVVKLSLEVSWSLGARLAGEVKREFQEQTVRFVEALETPSWLKVWLLGVTRSDNATSSLLKLVEDPDSYVRWSVVEALGDIGSEMAVPSLLKLVEDPDSSVRWSVVEALGKIGSKMAVSGLLKLVEDSSMCRSAVKALVNIGTQTAISGLLKLVKDLDSNGRRSVVEALGDIRAETAVSGLLKLVEDPDSSMRRGAAEALSKIGTQTAVPSLLKLVEDLDSNGRRSVVEALGDIGTQTAVSGLLKLVEDPDSSMRRGAAEALGKIGTQTAISGLLKLLEDADSYVRRGAVEALGKIGTQTAISGLLKLLEDADSYVRRGAVEALGKIGTQTAVPSLLKLLEDADCQVRWRAAEALGDIRSEMAVPSLLKLVEDPNSNVRGRAVKALGKIGTQTAISGLLKLLEDADSSMRWRAAEALSKIGTQTAISGLLKLVEDPDSYVRWSVVEALGDIGSEMAVPSLLKLLEDADCQVRWRAAEALGDIGSEMAVPSLLKLVEDPVSYVCERALKALGKIGTQAAVPSLLKLVEDLDSNVRRSVVEALGDIGTQTAVSSLLKLVENPDSNVRRSVVEALGKIGTQTAVSGLLKLVEDLDSNVRRSVVEALGKIGTQTAVSGLLKLLEHSDSYVRRSVVEALGKIGTQTAVSGLLKLLEHSDSYVRRSTAEALGKIVKNQTAEIVQHIPHLLTLIPTNFGQDALRVILAIQENCKYYNYALTQTFHAMKLFFSYAHKDEALRDTLATHLALLKRQGIITTWHDRDVTAGTEWAQAIDSNLNTANIILLLISANFLASDYCYDTEMQRALERHHNGEARVIPILLKPCDWEGAPFGKLQALPIAHSAGAKPVTQWSNEDEAFTAIAVGIRQAAEELKKTRIG